MSSPTSTTSFAALPSELIHHVLACLPACDLLSLSLTNHQFNIQTNDENLWKQLVLANFPPSSTAFDCSPFPSWRSLYLAYYPYWFLTRQKLWLADIPHTGKLVFIRYDPRRGCIEGYQLNAYPGIHEFTPWAWNREVTIHTFRPQVHLHLDSPELKINNFDQSRAWPRNWRKGDLPMVTGRERNRIFSDLVLAKEIPEKHIDPKMILWPPKNMPSEHHVRASSRDNFRSSGHNPHRIDEISQHAFRLRKRAQFITHLPVHNLLSSEETSTFSAIDPALYTPTPQKPWRGIWVGDYSGHGCEFLLVMQPDAPPSPTPRPRTSSISASGSDSSSTYSDTDDDRPTTADGQSSTYPYPFPISTSSTSRYITPSTESLLQTTLLNSRSSEPPPPDPEGIYHGRLEAMKLTGDPNVPRGEFTFVADDIGPGGFVRVSREEEGLMKGARVVWSRGHVAANDFRDDEFLPSQLFMISKDKLAQYWVPFGHVNFYERVDVEALMRQA